MVKQPYSYQLKVLVGIGWDRREFLEPNLHVYGEDDIGIIVYSMEEWLEEGHRKKNHEIFVIRL